MDPVFINLVFSSTLLLGLFVVVAMFFYEGDILNLKQRTLVLMARMGVLVAVVWSRDHDGSKKMYTWVKLIFSPLKFDVSVPPPGQIEIMNSYLLGKFIGKLSTWSIVPALALAIYVGWLTGNVIYDDFIQPLSGELLYELMTALTIIFSVFGGFVVAVLIVAVPLLLGVCANDLLDEVSVIGEDPEISDALSLSDQYPEINAYRIAVISQGRMLLKGDLKAMTSFAKEAKPNQVDATELALQQYRKDRAHEKMRRLLTP